MFVSSCKTYTIGARSSCMPCGLKKTKIKQEAIGGGTEGSKIPASHTFNPYPNPFFVRCRFYTIFGSQNITNISNVV